MKSGFKYRVTHSSSSSFIIGEKFPSRQLQNALSLLSCNGRKLIKKLFQALAAFQTIEQVLDRHSCADEDWRTAHLLRINFDKLVYIHWTKAPGTTWLFILARTPRREFWISKIIQVPTYADPTTLRTLTPRASLSRLQPSQPRSPTPSISITCHSHAYP